MSKAIASYEDCALAQIAADGTLGAEGSVVTPTKVNGIPGNRIDGGAIRGANVKPEWLMVLTLAFEQGLQDKAIAERMNVAERTVRHYWTKIQDALDVYPEGGKNIRIQTERRAREEGLID